MPAESGIRADGIVKAVLSERLYRVVLANGHEFYGHLPARAVAAGARFALGDAVKVAMTPYDLSQGRIEWQKKEK
jgi:translation initiation factor IF-1